MEPPLETDLLAWHDPSGMLPWRILFSYIFSDLIQHPLGLSMGWLPRSVEILS
jgi:hypothetical protein